MINQHQFQQAAKHYRSGRISLSEFQALASSGIQTKTGKTDPKPNRNADIIIQRGDTGAALIDTLHQLKSAGHPVLVTGVCEALSNQLSQQIADGEFDSAAQTFTCKNESADSTRSCNLAVVAVVEVDARFETGYLAALIASK